MPREVVYIRAMRFEAQGAVSVHPAVPLLADQGVDLTGAVAEALRAAMVAYDRR